MALRLGGLPNGGLNVVCLDVANAVGQGAVAAKKRATSSYISQEKSDEQLTSQRLSGGISSLSFDRRHVDNVAAIDINAHPGFLQLPAVSPPPQK